MFRPGRTLLLAFAAPILLAAPLLAQRYEEHDHTVFHRPVPPPPKHQSGTPNTAAGSHAPVATNSGNAARTSDPNRHHDVTFNSPPSSTEIRTPQTPQPGK
ncbi:MAG: hypothetical protein WB555_01920 [Candidatus Korobacteraceae bacterium]